MLGILHVVGVLYTKGSRKGRNLGSFSLRVVFLAFGHGQRSTTDRKHMNRLGQRASTRRLCLWNMQAQLQLRRELATAVGVLLVAHDLVHAPGGKREMHRNNGLGAADV